MKAVAQAQLTWTVHDGIAEVRSSARASAESMTLGLDGYWQAVRAHDGGTPLPILAHVDELEGIDAESRRILYQRAGEFKNVPVAVVGRGGAQRILFDFLFLVMRHRHAKYFTRPDEAMAWLEGQRGGGSR